MQRLPQRHSHHLSQSSRLTICRLGTRVQSSLFLIVCSLRFFAHLFTAVGIGRHWGPVIPTSAEIGSPGLRRVPYSFRLIPRGILGAWIKAIRAPVGLLVNQSNCTDEHVEHWCSLTMQLGWQLLLPSTLKKSVTCTTLHVGVQRVTGARTWPGRAS
jgi:hypothetical protein